MHPLAKKKKLALNILSSSQQSSLRDLFCSWLLSVQAISASQSQTSSGPLNLAFVLGLPDIWISSW